MPDKTALSRRRFLKTAAGASTLAALPYFVPASVLGKGGAVPPSEKILVGGIGIQRRGMDDLHWIMGQRGRAVRRDLRLQKKRRGRQEHRRQQYGNKDCAMYPDIREFLAAQPDIDAVLIATGDRWHAMASIMAMRAGKDVYSEKPSCMTIAEGQSRGRDRPALRPRLPDRHAAAERGELHVFGHRAGSHRPAGQGPHGLRPHRPVGRGRDAARLAARRARAAQGRGGLGRVARPVPLAAVQLRATSAAGGAASTTSTPVASANGARTRSPSARLAIDAPTPRPVEYEYVNNRPATAWSRASPTA